MSDIAYKVIVNNNGTDDIIFKTIMLKGNNGSSIASIEKTSTSGNVDTYTVYLDDGTVGGTFTVTNSDASSLNSLTDVTISSAQAGQALIYDGTAGKWKNADIAQSLADQTDVALSSLADGDALVYDSATGKWKNEALPDELSELDDVAISSAQNGEALIFNAVTGKWENGDVVENLESLSDVAISSAQDGNVLAYDANTGKWSNINISIAQSLDDLTDVDITSASDGQALIYDANSGEWKNGSVSTVGSLDDLTDVDITSAVAGDSLRYDGSGWVNQPTKIVMTQAQWNAISDKQAWRNAHKNTDLVISDAPNLNATAQNLSYDGGVTSTYNTIDGILHPTKIWSGSKYTLNDYIDIPDFDKDTIYMFEFMAFSGTYHTCFVSPVGDGYLQFVIWGDNTQHCRYRVQINTNSGRLTLVDVVNGGTGQALVAIYAII